MPVLNIGNASVAEGAGTLTFTVRLSVSSSKAVTVSWKTADGTAEAGKDYTAVTDGRVTFSSEDALSKTISVTISDDNIVEANETFRVTLSNAVNATLEGDGSTLEATGTITNDDEASPDRAALIAFYDATGGDNWRRNTNWKDENKPISQWHGVTVSPQNRVTRLELTNNRLTGSIPSELGDLSNLQRLFLNNNQLSGSIPSELGNLSNLRRLSLANNSLTGQLPRTFTALANLNRLRIQGNAGLCAPGDAEFQAYVAALDIYSGQTCVSPEVVVNPTSLTVDEGSTGIYTVKLTSEPTEVVTVGVSMPTGTDVSASPTSLIFTADDWSTAQTVTVSAAADTDAVVDDQVTITHSVSSTGDYSGKTASSVTVSITETTVPVLSIGNVSAAEGAGTLSFTVRLSVASREGRDGELGDSRWHSRSGQGLYGSDGWPCDVQFRGWAEQDD